MYMKVIRSNLHHYHIRKQVRIKLSWKKNRTREKRDGKKKRNERKINDWKRKWTREKWTFFFHSDPLFVCEDSFLKGFQEEVPSEECKIPNSDPLFGDKVSYVKGIKDEKEWKPLILSTKLNDEC